VKRTTENGQPAVTGLPCLESSLLLFVDERWTVLPFQGSVPAENAGPQLFTVNKTKLSR
jgi:hypothetical protein